MKKIISLIISLVLLFLLTASIPGAQNALASNGEFTQSDLSGVYAFSAEGTVYPSFPALSPALPGVAVGLFTFDGAGGCTVMDQLNLASLGLVPSTGFRTSTTCQYTVNPDGTGTLESSFGGSPGDINGPSSLTFVIVDKGPVMEICFIRVDLGVVATGVARQQ